MATKKPPAKPAKPATQKPTSQLQNLAARPASFDDALAEDEQLVDHSGVFRVTAAIQQAQTGHEDDSSPRFANDSLVMAAQRDGFREVPEDTLDEVVLEDEAQAAAKRQRLATLAALAAKRQKRR